MNKNNIITAVSVALALIFAVLCVIFAVNGNEPKINEAAIATASECMADIDKLLAGQGEQYYDFLKCDLTALIKLYAVNGYEKKEPQLSADLRICFGLLQSRPEACMANINLLYKSFDAAASGKKASELDSMLLEFIDKTTSYTVTE